MADYLLTEAELSGEVYEDWEIVEPFLDKDKEFIDDDDLDEKEDIDFYRNIDKKIMLTGDETFLKIPILKRRVGTMRIESDSSSSEYEDGEKHIGIPNCVAEDSNEDEQVIPESMLPVYGIDNFEWNHCENPKGDVCEFRGHSSYLSSFLYSLYKTTKNNAEVKKFLPMAKNYVGELTSATAKILIDLLKDEYDSGKIKQAKNDLYLTLLYALRHVTRGKTYRTTDFSCLEGDMLKELKGIENEILYDKQTTFLNNKLHLTNEILIRYGYFLKVYTMEKKIRYWNIGDQEK